jgi:hypothetical protein
VHLEEWARRFDPAGNEGRDVRFDPAGNEGRDVRFDPAGNLGRDLRSIAGDASWDTHPERTHGAAQRRANRSAQRRANRWTAP